MSVHALPEDEANRLIYLRDHHKLPELRTRIRALRSAGWTGQQLADAIGAYRSTINLWEHHYNFDPKPVELDSLPRPPAASETVPSPKLVGRRFRPGVYRPEVTTAVLSTKLHADARAELHELSTLARRVRRGTSEAAANRRAGERLNSLLNHHRWRGVSVTDLAAACDVSERAIRTRLNPELPELDILERVLVEPTVPVVVIWPAESPRTRRWRTYVEATTHVPILWPQQLLSVDLTTVSPNWRVLGAAEARKQLGWPTFVNYPLPIARLVGGHPL